MLKRGLFVVQESKSENRGLQTGSFIPVTKNMDSSNDEWIKV